MIYLTEELIDGQKIMRAGSLLGPGGSALALALYIHGLAYCRRHLTDGWIPAAIVERCPHFPTAGHADVTQIERDIDANSAETLRVPCARIVAKALCDRRVRLWHPTRDGYRVHDYLDMNESADKAKARRELARLRKRRQRERDDTIQHVTGEEIARACHGVTQYVTRDVTRDSVRACSTYHLSTSSTSVQLATYDQQARSTSGVQEPARSAPSFPQAVENRVLAWRRRRSKGIGDDGRPKLSTLTALARDVLRAHPDLTDEGELMATVKAAAARTNLAYDGPTVGKAIDAARRQRRRLA